MIVNVKDVGQDLLDQGFKNAKGNGGGNPGDDDFDALQRLIDPSTIPSAERNPPGSAPPPQPGALYFPQGRYVIGQTLVFPEKTGYHLIGSGMTARSGSLASNLQSAIAWNGADGGTMIDYRGTGLVWDGLSVWGKRLVGSDNKAGVGLKLSKPLATSVLNTGKVWFPAIYITECDTGILADGDLSADSCAFGYYWPHGCGTALHLDGTNATMFTFRYVHPLSSDIVFKVTGGAGRIYTHSLNILKMDTLLDVSGASTNNSFFHLNGLTMDGGARDFYLLKNEDDGDGLTHVRMTNCHFINVHKENNPIPDQLCKVLIDRSASTSGQTVLELVGCRGLTVGPAPGKVLTENVEIKGASSSKKSRIIVRDCELPVRDERELIKPGSQHFTENRLKNWIFSGGLRPNESSSG